MKRATTQGDKPKLTGFDHELDFWRRFVKSDRFREHWVTDKPNPELSLTAARVILSVNKFKPKVLDVGSGAASVLRGTIPAENITEVDPLADEYRKIYPQCQAKKGFVENLDTFGQFDVVHISNALDHCQDPMQGLASMIRACKPGGLVYIQGFTNEATWHNREGLHQWDIDVWHNRIVISGQYRFVYQPEKVVISETEVLRPKAKKSKVWFHFAFRKRR